MKKIILATLTFLIAAIISHAQVSFIGNAVNKEWLDRFFYNSNYSLLEGSFDIDSHLLVRGKAKGCHNNVATTIETGRSGRCYTIELDYNRPNTPEGIKSYVENFMKSNGFTIKSRTYESDGNFFLKYEGEKLSGYKLFSAYMTAAGSFNGFGEYWHKYFTGYIICTAYN